MYAIPIVTGVTGTALGENIITHNSTLSTKLVPKVHLVCNLTHMSVQRTIVK